MKRRMVSILLVALLVLGCFTSAFAADYSYLDGMSLDEMLALQNELETRISAARAAAASDPTNLGIWDIKYYVDEFKNPTSEGYVSTKDFVEGTFSNSATTGSLAFAFWAIEKKSAAITLVEYGQNIVKGKGSYSIIMLDPDGIRFEMKGGRVKNSSQIIIDSKYFPTLIDAFRKNGSVSFVITEIDTSVTSTYYFTIEDTTGFENAYSQI